MEDLAELGVGLRIHQKRLLRLLARDATVDHVFPSPGCVNEQIDFPPNGTVLPTTILQWFRTRFDRWNTIARVTRASSELQHHQVEISQYFDAYDTIVRHQRQHIASWVELNQRVLLSYFDTQRLDKLVDETAFEALFSFVRVHGVAGPQQSGRGSDMFLVPVCMCCKMRASYKKMAN